MVCSMTLFADSQEKLGPMIVAFCVGAAKDDSKAAHDSAMTRIKRVARAIIDRLPSAKILAFKA
jgi:hypothetical protein